MPLAAETLESRAMLATTATLSGDLSGFTQIPVTFLRPDGSVGFSRTAYVGQLGWSAMTGDAAAAGVPAAFKSFCIDGLQSVAPGTNSFAEVRPLAASSLLGATRSGLLADFWRQYGPADAAGFADKTDSAAFQLAVWEIINDGLPVGTRLASDLATGQFSVAAAGRTMSAALRAAQWLAGFDTTAPGKTAVALHALQSPTRQDQVVCVPLPNITVQVASPSVAEDGPQKLTYTFTASAASATPIVVNYAISGTATAASDFTGLPAGTGVRSITIPANATTASVAVFPIPDAEIEYDETVVLTLLPGAGYALGTRTAATGTIENDDRPFIDIILADLPEETSPEPNEITPGASLLTTSRIPLELKVSRGYAGTVSLIVLTGADKVILWDSETGGSPVTETQWPAGQQPSSRFWVESTGIPGDVQFVAMFQVGNETATDEARLKASDLSLRLIQKSAYADSTNAADAEKINELATIAGTTADAILKAPLEAVNPATGAVVGRMQTVRRFKADLLQYEVVNGKGGWAVSEKLKLDKVAVTSMALNGLNPPAEVLAIFEAGWKKELAASYANVEQVAGVLGGPFLPVGSITKENQFNDILGLAVPPEITGFEIVLIQEIFVQSPGIGKVLVGKIEYRWSSAAGAAGNFTLARKVLK